MDKTRKGFPYKVKKRFGDIGGSNGLSKEENLRRAAIRREKIKQSK